MPLDEHSQSIVEAFRAYIEDYVGTDERYGKPTRHDRDDGTVLITRFEAAPSCWFEVALHPTTPQIRVGFLTDDQAMNQEIEQAIQESGDTLEKFVGFGFQDAGLDWAQPPVEHYKDDEGHFGFVTPLVVENLPDLEAEDLRDQTLRMLEGYLIAFGPAIVVEEEE